MEAIHLFSSGAIRAFSLYSHRYGSSAATAAINARDFKRTITGNIKIRNRATENRTGATATISHSGGAAATLAAILFIRVRRSRRSFSENRSAFKIDEMNTGRAAEALSSQTENL